MYQSGCEPAEMPVGLYGPYIQMGLICAKVDSSVVTPKMKKNQAPVFAMKYGYICWPTTFLSVARLPGICVCF